MIWFDGTIRPDGPIPLDPGDRGLLLGDGVFETVGVFHRKPFALADHLESLAAGAAALGFAVPMAMVEQAVADLVAAMAAPHGALRITVSRGVGQRGLAPPADPKPVVLAGLSPWTPAMAGVPVRLATVAIRRNESSPLSRLKSLAYLDNVLMLAQARDKGADDALVLNTQGRVTGSAMANLFMIKNGTVVTPPVSEGLRPGIMRTVAIRLFDAIERPIDPEDLDGAALFLTNSLRLLSPVMELDGRAMTPLAPDYAAKTLAACGL